MSTPESSVEQNELTQRMVVSATLLGINIVQTIAAETLKAKPELSLRDFTKILNQYVNSAKQA